MRTTIYKQLTTDISSSKLLQKSNVVFEQQTNVVQFIDSRAGAINTEAEREPGKFFRVHAGGAQHVGMHHAGTTQLDPSAPLADAAAWAAADETTVVDFGARLHKR